MGILVPMTYSSASKRGQGHSASFPAVLLDRRLAADSSWPAKGVRARSLCCAAGPRAVRQTVSEVSFERKALKEAGHSAFKGWGL